MAQLFSLEDLGQNVSAERKRSKNPQTYVKELPVSTILGLCFMNFISCTRCQILSPLALAPVSYLWLLAKSGSFTQLTDSEGTFLVSIILIP